MPFWKPPISRYVSSYIASDYINIRVVSGAFSASCRQIEPLPRRPTQKSPALKNRKDPAAEQKL
jgi:hypothetical protein